MIFIRIVSNTLESRVLRYFYRNRKRHVDLIEVAEVFKTKPEDMLLILRGLQEDKLLAAVNIENDPSYRFRLTDQVKEVVNGMRNAVVILAVLVILAIYTIVRNLVL
jgi:predicted transcriptional regulator with HTH domain